MILPLPQTTLQFVAFALHAFKQTRLYLNDQNQTTRKIDRPAIGFKPDQAVTWKQTNFTKQLNKNDYGTSEHLS